VRLVVTVFVGAVLGYVFAWFVKQVTGLTPAQWLQRWWRERRIRRAGPILRREIDRLEAERDRLRQTRL
jgi:hypothetical protein